MGRSRETSLVLSACPRRPRGRAGRAELGNFSKLCDTRGLPVLWRGGRIGKPARVSKTKKMPDRARPERLPVMSSAEGHQERSGASGQPFHLYQREHS